MAYASGNPKTKKALKSLIADGAEVRVFNPGIGQAKQNGIEYIEGPHFPKPHSWYAQVEVTNGLITKVVK